MTSENTPQKQAHHKRAATQPTAQSAASPKTDSPAQSTQQSAEQPTEKSVAQQKTHPISSTKIPTGLDAQLIRQTLIAAFQEDLGQAGDITSQAIIPETTRAKGWVMAREDGVLAGSELAIAAFRYCDKDIAIRQNIHDGTALAAGDNIMEIDGTARALLAGERIALNYLCHLSGIASRTKLFVDAIADTQARITCTRKTTPGLRAFEKYAVRCGGGINHRFGLHDGILIKDNHIIAAGGITQAVMAARKRADETTGEAAGQAGSPMPVEVEVDDLQQLAEALTAGADAVLLDNMPVPVLQKAVSMIAGHARTGQNRIISEASGGVRLDNVCAIAQTGVDYISVGGITHSAAWLDLGLDCSSA